MLEWKYRMCMSNGKFMDVSSVSRSCHLLTNLNANIFSLPHRFCYACLHNMCFLLLLHQPGCCSFLPQFVCVCVREFVSDHRRETKRVWVYTGTAVYLSWSKWVRSENGLYASSKTSQGLWRGQGCLQGHVSTYRGCSESSLSCRGIFCCVLESCVRKGKLSWSPF